MVLFGALVAGYFLAADVQSLSEMRARLLAPAGPEVQCFQGHCFEVSGDGTALTWGGFSTQTLRQLIWGLVLILSAGSVAQVALGLGVGSTSVPSLWTFRQARSYRGLFAVLVLGVGLLVALTGAGAVVQGLIGGLVFSAFLVLVVRKGFVRPKQGDVRLRYALSATLMTAVSMLFIGALIVGALYLGGFVLARSGMTDLTPYIGNSAGAVGIAAVLGIALSFLPLMAVPVVVFLAVLGAGVAPATTLLAVLAASVLALHKQQVATGSYRRLARSAWVVGTTGVAVGLIVWGIAVLVDGGGDRDASATTAGVVDIEQTRGQQDAVQRGEALFTSTGESGEAVVSGESTMSSVAFRGEPARKPPAQITAYPSLAPLGLPVQPFINVAQSNLDAGYTVWNDRPGVAIFDFDRDGHLDFYLTQKAGFPNFLYRNNGDGTFTNVAAEAGVD
ncbi:MAG: hypothetical protein FJ317_02930, partial [SAR202 cluster bacterium]|nr:hypothetical protein [SAR202 cluster bacterium]